MFLRQAEIPDMESERDVDRLCRAEVQTQGPGIVAGTCLGWHAHGQPKRLLDADGERQRCPEQRQGIGHPTGV